MQKSAQMEHNAIVKPATTAVLIANPTSGSYLLNAYNIALALSMLRQHNWQVELKFTQCSGDARRITQEAVEQHIDIVVAIGGDGTINEIIQALAGSETALGVLPAGTVNVWAREIGISLDLISACETLLNGQIRRIDLGKINERYFLLMVGIGIDGEVTHAIEKKPVKRLGIIGYLLIAAWMGIRYQAFRALIEIGKREFKANALQIIVGNTQLYGGALKYTWRARCDDGLLDLCVIRKQSLLGRIFVLFDFLLRREQRRQWIRYDTANAIKLYTRKPIAIQVDGEPMGYTSTGEIPTTLSIVPQALKVVVPQSVPEELFSQP